MFYQSECELVKLRWYKIFTDLGIATCWVAYARLTFFLQFMEAPAIGGRDFLFTEIVNNVEVRSRAMWALMCDLACILMYFLDIFFGKYFCMAYARSIENAKG